MSLINRLIDVLEREYGLYGQLVAILEAENEALKMWDTDAVDSKVREKEAVSSEIRNMGEEIRRLLRGIAAEKMASAGELTLGLLAKNEENPAVGKRLFEIREKLLIISAKTAELNNANRSLIANAVTITKKCIKYLNSVAGGTVETYLPGKMAEEKMRPGLLLTRSY